MTPRRSNSNTLTHRPLAWPPRSVKPALSRWPQPTRPGAESSAPAEAASDALVARVEAVLFLASEPITTRRLAKLANLADATQARTLVSRLAQRYESRASGLTIEQVAGGYRLLTRPRLAPWVQKLHGATSDLSLSPSALETIAVVAYRQPVVRAEVEAVRGVQCGELLRQLIERDLLRIVGRSTELGRPLQYGTTKRFLEAFGLSELTDLPPLGESPTMADTTSQRRLAA